MGDNRVEMLPVLGLKAPTQRAIDLNIHQAGDNQCVARVEHPVPAGWMRGERIPGGDPACGEGKLHAFFKTSRRPQPPGQEVCHGTHRDSSPAEALSR
jgi:uncharacterized protein (DUF983 family)